MASRKEYEMLFQLNAQMGSSYSSTFKNAQTSIASMQKEISALSKTQSDISAYQKQQDAVENSRKKLEALQQQYDNIQKEMQETGTFSSALENRLLAKQQQIDKTAASLEAQTGKLNHMGDALRGAGVNTDNLTGETAKLGNQIDDLKKKQDEAASKASDFGTSASTAFTAAGQALAAAGMAMVLKQIHNEFKEVVNAAMEFETVMASVRRTVGGSNEEIEAMADYFQAMSEFMPITTSEIGKIAETAGQLGIAQDKILEFTRVMAMLGTTTDLSAENAATMLAQFANITGLTDYERLGAVVADLGDATATTASKVVDMSQGMAAAATIAGFSETDIMAVAAAVGSLGIESQAGATAMSTLISSLYKAVETGSDKLGEFASVAGMSAKEFASAWREDAVSAMDAFIRGLGDTEQSGKSAIVVLDELGITNVRQTKAILGLASAGDLLTNTIAQASQAWNENTALTNKANIMYETTQSQLIMMQNAYAGLKVTLGEQFTPALQELYAGAAEVFSQFTAFVEEHPELVKAIATITTTLLATTAALIGLSAAVKVFKALEMASMFKSPVGIILGTVAVVASLTTAIIALSNATKTEADEARYLTEASREQFFRLQELKEEYKEASNIYSENHDEMRKLRWEIEDAEAEYRRSKKTLAEYSSEVENVAAANRKLIDSHHESIDSIDKEEWHNTSLISKLAELAGQNEITAASQTEMKAIIDRLNEALPQLNLNYDNVIAKGPAFIEGLKGIAKAEAEQQRYNASYNDYVNLLMQATELENKVTDSQDQMAIAKERQAKADQEYMDSLIMISKYDMSGTAGLSMMFSKEDKELKAATKALDEYEAAIASATAELEENRREQEAIIAAFGDFADSGKDAADVNVKSQNTIRDITSQINSLTEAYNEAYLAALDSVSGQYNLWDHAADVVAVSASEINNALQSQINYWHNYNENVAALTDRAGDIEGLSELLASFADGGEKSVNAVAGMAKASDKDLAAMVENWQKLKEEQKTVADSLANVEEDYRTTLQSLQDELEGAIQSMDLSEEAAQSGKNLIEGFINGANDMLPQVQKAYEKIADAAVSAIDKKLEIRSPSKVLELRGEYAMSGFVGGVDAMEPEVAAAMADAAHSGANAFALEQNQLIRQFNTMSRPAEAVHANVGIDRAGSANKITNPVFNIEYNITGVGSSNELESILESRDADLKGYILDVLEDARIDGQRRAFA